MKHIHYDSSVVTTGDAIAEAVIEYAAALGAHGRSDTVDVPTFDEHGSSTVATLLIGPASQIVIVDAPDDELEPEDDELVARLHAASRAAGDEGPPHADADGAH